MAYYNRAQWGAAPWKRPPTEMSDANVETIFVHYNGPPITLTGFALPRAIQRYHLNTTTSNYRDVAYSFLVDVLGNRFGGRGFNVQDGATSPSEAGKSYSIFVGVGKGQKVSVDALLAVREQIESINRHVGRELDVKPHRDAWSTACPGEALTEWISRGMPVASDVKSEAAPVIVLAGPEAPKLPRIGRANLRVNDIRNVFVWRKRRIDALQRALGFLGYDIVGTGPWGPATSRAVLQFCKDVGLVRVSYQGDIVVGKAVWRKLREALVI